MLGYIDSLKSFIKKDSDEIVSYLVKEYPCTSQSQVESWVELIRIIKASQLLKECDDELIIGIEYLLPTDNMGIDLFVCGKNGESNVLYILESKQWGDEYISGLNFSKFRTDDTTLYPQVQVNRYKIAVRDYLDLGEKIDIIKCFVYIENASTKGIIGAMLNDGSIENKIPIYNNLDDFFNCIINDNSKKPTIGIGDFLNAKYMPSKDIINAMNSIATKEEPFILTKVQEEETTKIIDSIKNGKRIIHISGSAGSGKTAILLNLFIYYLNERNKTGVTPYFSSGCQNTALYRSLYSSVQNMFAYTFSLERGINQYSGPNSIIMLDEAQTNQNGLVLNLVNTGAIVIFCYDENQIVNLDNALTELPNLRGRSDYIHFSLDGSVRFNGSCLFEQNVKNFLESNKEPVADDKYDFIIVHSMEEFKNRTTDIILNNPKSTVALSGLLCNNASAIVQQSNGFFFTKWGLKEETKWIPYVKEMNYYDKFAGSLWCGTWWMPGLDVDYNIVIIGSDAKMTKKGIIGDATESKLFNTINSILKRVNIPMVDRLNGVCKNLNTFLDYCNKPGNSCYRDYFEKTFNMLIKNYYYVMLTRGKKGCLVYFTEEE